MMRSIRTFTLALVLTGWPAALAHAQTTRPALDALDRDMRALFADIEQRTVRVNVPVQIGPTLLNEHPLTKWAPQMDPKVREQLAATARNQADAPRVFVEPPRPATQGGNVQPVATQPQAIQPGAGVADGARVLIPPQTPTINVEFIGLVLDEQGHVLVPLFIDANNLQRPLQVSVNDQVATTASVVSADAMTALTVIKLQQPAGKPIRFAAAEPDAGSLILMFAPTKRMARLNVWSGRADETGVMVDAGGSVCGIVRNQHALFPSMFVPVVEQLKQGGPVKRAQLGVMIHELTLDHPVRAQIPALGARPAARVQGVFENSPAAKGGLQAGDLILRINDDAVEDIATFAAAIASCRGKTDIHILRNGEAKTLSVDLQPK